MIVDLMRNDLGRVVRVRHASRAGARRAAAAPGRLAPRLEVRGARCATGTATPTCCARRSRPARSPARRRSRRCSVIAELEATGREVYTGAIGFASPLAGLELNVAIRTFEGRRARSGSAPAAGSSPTRTREAELAEALGKAAPIARALGARVPDPPPAGARRPRACRALAAPPRPRAPACSRRSPCAAARRSTPARHLARLARERRRAVRRSSRRVELPASRRDGAPCASLLRCPAARSRSRRSPEPAAATRGRARAARAAGRPRRAQVARPRRRTPRPGCVVDPDGDVLEAAWANVLDRGRRRDARHAARRRPHPARRHPRAAARRAAHPDARGPDRARRAGARGGDRADLLAPARHPRRAAPPAERRGAGARRPPARRPRYLHENALVHSLIRAHARLLGLTARSLGSRDRTGHEGRR